MAHLKNILNDLLTGNHKPRGETKYEPFKPDSPAPAKPETRQSGPVRRISTEDYGKHFAPPARPDMPKRDDSRCEFDENGKHLWTWSGDEKKCAWCDVKGN